MKWNEDQLRAFDKQYEGRLNPRASYDCTTCKKFYGEIDPFKNVKDDETTLVLIVDDKTSNITDCVHFDDIEIPEHIWREHMQTCLDAGLFEDGFNPLEEYEKDTI